MNDLMDSRVQHEITVTLHMVDGSLHVQPLPMDNSDYVDDLLKWYRKPWSKCWAWHCLNDRMVHIFQHSHIIAIDVEGYIEPDEIKTRWYHKLINRVRTWWMLRKAGVR